MSVPVPFLPALCYSTPAQPGLYVCTAPMPFTDLPPGTPINFLDPKCIRSKNANKKPKKMKNVFEESIVDDE